MSQTPFYVDAASRSGGFRLGHQEMVDGVIKDGLWDPYGQFRMGDIAELCAEEHQVSRQDQDSYAVASYSKAIQAQQRGIFRKEIEPVTVPIPKGTPVAVTDDEEPSRVGCGLFF